MTSRAARPVGRGLWPTALLALLLGLAVLPAAPAGAATGRGSWDVSGTTTLRLVGHGFGHGHGLSQYGAEGAARAGLTAAEIIAFYYPGTDVGRARGRLRVLLTADADDRLVVLPTPRLAARDLTTGERTPLLALGAGLGSEGQDADRYRLRPLRNGGTEVAAHVHREGWTRLLTTTGDAQVGAGRLPVTLVAGGAERAYRGVLRSATVTPGERTRDTVNVVTLEDYLRGVVPREVPASWTPAAVQAQAIAARTYAAYERDHPRASHYDLCDTTSCQVYGGVTDEHPASDAAVEATAGTVVEADGAPAFTQFSASSGGWTSAGSAPYLVAQEDPWDDWSGNTVHEWSTDVTVARLEALWPVVGDLQQVRVLDRDGNGQWKGRVRSLRLVGDAGAVTMSGDAFRSALGLRSTWFTFRLRG
ncbi:SpoIID/LytB domain-containing protein [Nocardioides bruguierae]|uniref:SpoIID/LytB domain-containing protein n=1 Tax=Nocardioides bruguierae TaxID=2945102 RepID=A0A9X2IG89_9ACTN|nr:SpoIID/LytB domain-containing protein [Nocardioides bruguierae]MCM0621309.1 SpoIID/LytB domain-containing protein [Nocardioides bruguierae]